jgi:hypothetical protein
VTFARPLPEPARDFKKLRPVPASSKGSGSARGLNFKKNPVEKKVEIHFQFNIISS